MIGLAELLPWLATNAGGGSAKAQDRIEPTAPAAPPPERGLFDTFMQYMYPTAPTNPVPQVQQPPVESREPIPLPGITDVPVVPQPRPVVPPTPMTGGPQSIIPEGFENGTAAPTDTTGEIGKALGAIKAPATPQRNVPSTVSPPRTGDIESNLLQLLQLAGAGQQARAAAAPPMLSNQLRNR